MATLKNAYEISVVIKGGDGNIPDARELLLKIAPLLKLVGQWSKPFDEWLLGGNSLEEAKRHGVFEGDSPSDEAVAILSQKFKKRPGLTGITIWNGLEDDRQSLGLSYRRGQAPLRGTLSLTGGPDSFSSDWKSVANVLAKTASIFHPLWGNAESHAYNPKRVFNDRPGVGWMFYLPTTLTAQEVPEARAVHPVMDGKTQIGTILVSVTDTPFDHDGPEHIRVANEIEMRLANIDLLPRF